MIKQAGLLLKIIITWFTYRGDFELLWIVEVVHTDFSIGQEVVALDLPGEEEVPEKLVISTSQQLVEDVVAPLSRLLLDHTGLLQQVWMQ